MLWEIIYEPYKTQAHFINWISYSSNLRKSRIEKYNFLTFYLKTLNFKLFHLKITTFISLLYKLRKTMVNNNNNNNPLSCYNVKCNIIWSDNQCNFVLNWHSHLIHIVCFSNHHLSKFHSISSLLCILS